MPRYRLLDYYLRSVTTAMLAVFVVGIAAWETVHGRDPTGPFRDWAGLVIGVYFGSHVAFNGASARQRSSDPPSTT